MSGPHGLVIPAHFHAVLTHRRTVYSDAPGMYVDEWHNRLRWSCFALAWAAIGAQLMAEG